MFSRWFASKKDLSAIKKQLDEKKPNTWTVENVQDWLEINDLKELKPAFLKESMNGEALLDLSQDEIQAMGIKKIGHKKKLSKLVQDLSDEYTKSQHSSSKRLSNAGSNASTLDKEDADDSEELVNNPVNVTASMKYEFFEDFADGVCVMSGKDKQILYVNKTVERMFLYNRNDIIGANVKVLMAEPHRSKHDGYVDNYMKTKKAKIIGQGRMVEARMKDGTLFPLWLSIAESQDENGTVFIGTMKDLRGVQLHSKKKVTQMMTLLDNLVDGVVVMNQECHVMFFNKSAEKIFLWKSDEVVGKNINMLMQETLAAVHDSYVTKYMQTKQAKIIGKGREVVAKRKDGTLIKIFLSVTETKWDEDPNRVSFMGTIQLCTDIKYAVDSADFTPKQDKVQKFDDEYELFEEVLDIPHAKKLLTNFLQANKTSEMLQFLDDIDGYRATKSHRYRYSYATKLMNLYVKNESKSELNLPSKQRQVLLEKFATNNVNETKCPAEVFDEVAMAVKLDLVQGSFANFVQTQEYKAFFAQNNNLFSPCFSK